MKKRMILSLSIAMSQFLTSCAHHKPVTTAPPAPPRDPQAAYESPWTTWSDEKSMLKAMIELSHYRKGLLHHNLHDPHARFAYAPFKNIDCSTPEKTNFRTADGTCNDLSNPAIGAAGVAFGRNVPPEFIDLDGKDKLMKPDPALVSKEFFTREKYKEVPFLNMIAAVWIQFMNHDWLSHGRNKAEDPYIVTTTDGKQMAIEQTQDNKSSASYKREFGKVSLNTVTHWWDASQIYGSSQQEVNALRTHFSGMLKTQKVNGRTLLPKDESLNIMDNKQNQGVEMTGFRDNWWLGLSLLHTLFVREHNAIAAELMKKHVTYDAKDKTFTWKNDKDIKSGLSAAQIDEIVFNTARLINAAVLAKIHTVEWTPAILPNSRLRYGMYANWYGMINPQTWARHIKKYFKKTDWEAIPDLGYVTTGIVGSKANNYGVPFSITEEFTSVYRLHSLLPEKLNLRKMSDKDKVNAVPFEETRNEKSYAYMANYDTKDLFYSFGVQLPGQLVLNNFPKFMQEFTVPGHGIMDLGMVDVMRDRERGVPRYNQFRRGIDLKPINSYADFFPGGKVANARQQAIVNKFREVYGVTADGKDNVEAIDLLVGTLSEEVRPKNFGFGETLFHIFILMASRRLMADRFYTDYYKPEYYTATGINWVDTQGTIAQVIGRHMPELKPHMEGLETAFSPWKK